MLLFAPALLAAILFSFSVVAQTNRTIIDLALPT